MCRNTQHIEIIKSVLMKWIKPDIMLNPKTDLGYLKRSDVINVLGLPADGPVNAVQEDDDDEEGGDGNKNEGEDDDDEESGAGDDEG